MMGAPPGPATSNACSGDVGGAWTKCEALTASGGDTPDSNTELSARREQHEQNNYNEE